MTNRKLLLLASATAAALCAAAAHADAPDAATQVEELIVTAQKREQKTLEVPIAITAYGSDSLDKLGIQEFEELSLYVPGFEVQNQSPNNPGFVMRGITSDSGEATNEPRVSVFQDGVSISKSRGSYIELFDLQRVEIAKGPQSTLYGRGALIGAVNLVQAKANPAGWDAKSKVEVGNYGYAMFETMLNMPVSDTFAVRVSGRLKKRDGFVDNLLGGEDFNSTDTAAGRIALRWQPTDALKADLIFNYEKDRPSGTSFKSLTYLPADPTTGKVIGDLGRNSGAALSASDGFEGGKPLGLNRSVRGLTALVDYKISDSLSLSSISAYRRFDSLEVFDPDGFSLPLMVFAEDAHGRQASQEVRLNYDAGGKLTAFGGVSYFWEDGYQRVPLQFNEKIYALVAGGLLPKPAGLPLPVVTAVAPAALKPVHRETYANYGETKSYDAFADATYKVTDKLELTAGVRYTYDDKTSGYQAYLVNGGSVLAGSTATLARGLFLQPTANGAIQSKGITDSGLTYRLVGRYMLNDQTSLYASYARGRRPKVLAVGAPTTPGGAVRFTELPAEKVDSFEIGAKSDLFERRLSLEGSVYHYSYENFQTSVLNSAGQIVSANAGEASATGFEGQATARPTQNLEVFATYGHNHARFGNGLFKGNSFRLSPDDSVSFGLKASFDVLGGTLAFTPTYTWQSKVFFDSNNDLPKFQSADKIQDEVQGAYGLLNFKVGYTPANGPWAVEAFVTNALNEKYIKDAGNTGDAFGIATFIAGEPRYYGMSFSLKY
ncbi:TonB-dependent receptor [Phenylobacterium sp.]|uniref:TonB-dependent receptor n=1 Tax=Phenylobacterium sp. TaxID=1871053 RepID=UPI0035B40092